MRCTVCCHTDSRVLESRSAEGGRSVRRRRECLNCSNRFTTYERIEFVPITVLKRNGDRESFDNSKLLHGIARACEKTSISTQEQQRIVSDVESELQQRTQREIDSTEIGEIVLKQLRPLSEVAYVRFASVYQQFQSIRDFVNTLEQLRESDNGTHGVSNAQETSKTSQTLAKSGSQDIPRVESSGVKNNGVKSNGTQNNGAKSDASQQSRAAKPTVSSPAG